MHGTQKTTETSGQHGYTRYGPAHLHFQSYGVGDDSSCQEFSIIIVPKM